MKYEFTLKDGSKFLVPAEVFDTIAEIKAELSDARDEIARQKFHIKSLNNEILKLQNG